MTTIRQTTEIPQPAEAELNPAVLILDADAWLSYIIGDDDETPVLRFKNVKGVDFTSKPSSDKRGFTQSASGWEFEFGPKLVRIEAESVSVYWSMIDDVVYAIWEVANYIREQESAEHSLRNFYDSLTGEVDSETCRINDCSHVRIPQSVFCRRHHFEAIMKRPCPY